MQNFAIVRGISPLDLVLALFSAFICISDQHFMEPVAAPQRAALFLVACAFTVGTLLRRTYPVPAAAAVYIACACRFIIAPQDRSGPYALALLALYAVAVYGPKMIAIGIIAATSFGSLIIVILPQGQNAATVTGFLAILASQAVIAAIATGAMTRRQQFARIDQVLREAKLAQESAKQETELAVVNERTRIAREMHDIVAHTLSVVIAQADGAKYAARTNPEAASHSLEVISDMSRAALADIRSIIGVLRNPEDSQAPLSPQPVSADLAQLTDQVRDSGLAVSYVQTGSARPLPVGVGNALYRICQEALTNALKHAGPEAQVTVMLSWHPAMVKLEIADTGRGGAARNDSKGHGIIGMSERAAVFGGTVTAGPRAGGGFKVTATIPTPSERISHA